MTKDEAFNALTMLARELNPKLPADLSGHVVTISASLRNGVTATAYMPEPAIVRRADWHYDSQGYCDNPGRGY